MLRRIALLALLAIGLMGQAKFAPFQAASQVPLPPPAIVGTNMGQPISYFSSEQPLLNILKTQYWNTSTGEEALLYTSFLDANGYPTTLTGGPAHSFTNLLYTLNQLVTTDTSFSYHSGDYLLQWNGVAHWTVNGDASASCTTSPCKVTVSSPSASGLQIILTCTNTNGCTGSGITSDYGTNFSLIYCGTYTSGNPVGQKCSVTDPANSNKHVDALETECEGGTYTSCFNPDLTARLKGAPLLRFMQWNLGAPNTVISSWSNRRLPTWYSFADSPSTLTLDGYNPAPLNTAPAFYDGVPYEYQIALCNLIKADCYFVVPALADDTYMTNLGTLAGSTLNAPQKAWVELGNEIWNNTQAFGAIGTITGFVDDGSGAGTPSAGCTPGTPSGVAGKKLTVCTIVTAAVAGTPKLNGTLLVLGGAGLDNAPDGRPATQIMSQVSGTPGGIGIYNTTGGYNNPNQTISKETITVYVSVEQNLAWLGAQNYSGAAPNGGGAEFYGEYLRTVQIGHLFKAAFVAAGGSGSRVVRVAAGQNGLDGQFPGNSSAECILQAPPSTAACGGITGGPSEWYTGSGAGQLSTFVDVYVNAPYFGYNIPVAWGADADAGLTHLFTEIITGGVEPTAVVTGNCGNGAGKTCTPVDTAHYTLTSGNSYSSDPANGTMVMAIMNATHTTSGGQTFLKVDTMTSYPIFINDGTCAGTNPNSFDLQVNDQVMFAFTSALNSSNCGGAVTKGWRYIPPGQYWLRTPGMINDTLALAQSACLAANNKAGANFPLGAYEGASDFLGPPGAWPGTLYVSAMRDSRMATAYDTLFRNWTAMAGGCKPGTFIQFNDIFSFNSNSPQEYWGLLESVLQTSSPRYDLVHHTYWGQP